MQITTLMQASLNLASIKYKREGQQSNQDSFIIKITTTDPHGIYGSVKIQLANVIDVNVDGIANYFNTQILSFTRTGANTLEGKIQWSVESFNSANAMSPNTVLTDLRNNGSAITALVDNTILTTTNKSIKYYIDETKSNSIGTQAPINLVNINTKEYNDFDEVFYTTKQIYTDMPKRAELNIFDNKCDIFISEFTNNTKIVLKFFNKI